MLKFYNIQITEDSEVAITRGTIDEFEDGNFLHPEQGQSSIIDGLSQLDTEVDDALEFNEHWPEEYRSKFLSAIERIQELYNQYTNKAILFGWSIEYDQSWLIVYGESNEDIIKWYFSTDKPHD